MKIGLFSDPHYSSQEVTRSVRYNIKSLEKIKAAYSFLKKRNFLMFMHICKNGLKQSVFSFTNI